MHPDRRRRGRAIRKQRRLSRRRHQAFRAIGTAALAAAASMHHLGRAIARAVWLDSAYARLSTLAHAYSPIPVTIERHDMTTISITTPSTAPAALIEHILAFARDLHAEGLDVEVTLTRTCVSCNCTDDRACLGGCAWINDNDDLCTTCDTPNGRTLLQQHQQEHTNLSTTALAGSEVVKR